MTDQYITINIKEFTLPAKDATISKVQIIAKYAKFGSVGGKDEVELPAVISEKNSNPKFSFAAKKDEFVLITKDDSKLSLKISTLDKSNKATLWGQGTFELKKLTSSLIKVKNDSKNTEISIKIDVKKEIAY